MNVYEAKATFSPQTIASHDSHILPFTKGELFEVLETEIEGKNWWGARAFKDNTIGFVPASFFKKKNVSRSSSSSDINAAAFSRESHLQLLAELQQRTNFKDIGSGCSDMIPDPDYSDSDEDAEQSASQDPKPTLNGHITDDGTIIPRKLSNPCLDSKDHKNLHKELLFNQKIGKNVLNQKSELRKKMDKFQEDQRRKEYDQEQLNKRTVFEKKMEEQASKLKMHDLDDNKKEETTQDSEFMRVHAKLRGRMDCQ